MSDTLLSKPLTLSCGLVLPNRLAKAAMAEALASNQAPNEKHFKLYEEWADGDWGMILTGNVQVSHLYLGGFADISIPAPFTSDLKNAWKEWADILQRNGAPGIVQINHPGRQSPIGARGFFQQALAPSPIAMKVGSNAVARFITGLLFGVPREMTTSDISEAIAQFTLAAKYAFEAGFKGVEIHGAHGYLIAQFLSPETNKRTDAFGGSPAKRAEFVVRIIHEIRAATSKEFCIGIKLNSVDSRGHDNLEDVLEQLGLIIDAGVDFLEISGGTYENPTMGQAELTEVVEKPMRVSTAAREAFFLEFAKSTRARFPTIPLMVTGGFRTRRGMREALESGACDIVGVGRPAAVIPKLPKEIILNAEVGDEKAKFPLAAVPSGGFVVWLVRQLSGVGADTLYAQKQINRIASGLLPEYTWKN